LDIFPVYCGFASDFVQDTNGPLHQLRGYGSLLCTHQLPATVPTPPHLLALYHTATGAYRSMDGQAYILGIDEDVLQFFIIHKPCMTFRTFQSARPGFHQAAAEGAFNIAFLDH
jgi:hypothetical protein